MIDPNMTFGDFNQVEDSNGFAPIPRAIYRLRVTSPEIRPTNNGGQRVTMKLQVAEGEHQGRVIFESFNVVNSSPKAVQVSLQRLKSLFASAGLDTTGAVSWGAISASEGAICTAMVGIDKDNPDYNCVTRYIVDKSVNSNVFTSNSQSQQMTTQNMATTANNQNVSPQGNDMPWQIR